jgi:hypothetical protein
VGFEGCWVASEGLVVVGCVFACTYWLSVHV